MEYIIGAIVALLGAFFAFKPKGKDMPSSIDDDMVNNLKDDIASVDNQKKKVTEEGVPDLDPEKVKDYWRD